MTIFESTLTLIVLMLASIALAVGALFGTGGNIMMGASLTFMLLTPVAFVSYLLHGGWRSERNTWRPECSGRLFQVTMVLPAVLCAWGIGAVAA